MSSTGLGPQEEALPTDHWRWGEHKFHSLLSTAHPRRYSGDTGREPGGPVLFPGRYGV